MIIFIWYDQKFVIKVVRDMKGSYAYSIRNVNSREELIFINRYPSIYCAIEAFKEQYKWLI